MELSLYNVAMTSMSLNGKELTYLNRLASSDADKSVRYDWFWCACCLPNIARLYGSLASYLKEHGAEGETAFISLHPYTTAKVTFNASGKAITLEQTSNRPLEDVVKFELSAPDAQVVVRLRLSGWSEHQYSLIPRPGPVSFSVRRGCLTLDCTYLAANLTLSLEIVSFSRRHISPHPHTNQITLTLARGPIVQL